MFRETEGGQNSREFDTPIPGKIDAIRAEEEHVSAAAEQPTPARIDAKKHDNKVGALRRLRDRIRKMKGPSNVEEMLAEDTSIAAEDAAFLSEVRKMDPDQAAIYQPAADQQSDAPAGWHKTEEDNGVDADGNDGGGANSAAAA